jgi:DNA-binding XRE family transcriptional regulator
MKPAKKKRLEARGWVVGDVKSFLGLSDDEAAFIELKLVLSDALKKRRLAHGLTQAELAKQLDSSQSRVAKMESGDRSVSLDLLVRSLFATGMTQRELGKLITASARRSAA